MGSRKKANRIEVGEMLLFFKNPTYIVPYSAQHYINHTVLKHHKNLLQSEIQKDHKPTRKQEQWHCSDYKLLLTKHIIRITSFNIGLISWAGEAYDPLPSVSIAPFCSLPFI